MALIRSNSRYISSEQSIHPYGMWYLHTIYTNRHTLHRSTYTCNTATYTVVPISTAIYSMSYRLMICIPTFGPWALGRVGTQPQLDDGNFIPDSSNRGIYVVYPSVSTLFSHGRPSTLFARRLVLLV